MNSLEKLAQFQAQMTEAEAPDPTTEALQGLVGSIAPVLGPMLPNDPQVLDQYLHKLGEWCLAMRSDDAQQLVVGVTNAEAGTPVPNSQGSAP